MRAKWLKFEYFASIKVRVGGQCIAPKTRTTLILDRYTAKMVLKDYFQPKEHQTGNGTAFHKNRRI
jgi:hypothetical protein